MDEDEKNIKKLTEIGTKINNVIENIWLTGLTIEELEIFEAYVDEQETIAPLLNPTFIQKHGFKLFGEAKERIRAVKPVLQLSLTVAKEKAKEK